MTHRVQYGPTKAILLAVMSAGNGVLLVLICSVFMIACIGALEIGDSFKDMYGVCLLQVKQWLVLGKTVMGSGGM